MAVHKQSVSPVKTLTLCSVLASVTAILQLTAVFVPAAGHFISAFCTLPIALATVIRPAGGIFTTVAAVLIISMVQPLEVPVLLFTSAPLGWLLAAGLVYSRPRWQRLVFAGAFFFAGTAFLAYITGQLVLGQAFSTSMFYRVLLFNLLFTILYTAAWDSFVRQVVRRLSLFFPFLRC